ncbi:MULTISPECIES: hypothetical protein [Streptomyces]|uniref:hypothetical protein n=1 Tax=Streptomyces TaxID=1883 RepID=UPI00292F2118|nr:hypothetical protein [Streptomyces sp. NEAU-HV9]
MSNRRSLPRGRAWLRALVLLLVLLVPGARAEMHAAPVVAVDFADHDVLDTALRPPSRTAPRPVEPARTAPPPDPAPDVPQGGSPLATPWPPSALPALRSVVLRC